MNTSINLDSVLKAFGVQHIFLEYGKDIVQEKIEEIGDVKNPNPNWNYWCELSWNSFEYESLDRMSLDELREAVEVATVDFGVTAGEAIENCLKTFISLVKEGYEPAVKAAKHYGIYNKIMRPARKRKCACPVKQCQKHRFHRSLSFQRKNK